MPKLSHVDEQGRARMVDVGGKRPQYRTARAEGFIRLRPATLRLIRQDRMKKGDVLGVAQIAGIQAGKRTSELIPLCHPLQLSHVEVQARIATKGVRVEACAKCLGPTGVEMEALTAAAVALLTVYDMCKAADQDMVISDITLLEKRKSDEGF
ncbi:MAG: cyclic pyranopterin monophosphate synthase MoaC [Elusimicrobia bacterium]|nr:cyclic pyranopterin monophosphate synthase MoaC [Elusimicrobiota bacterium]